MSETSLFHAYIVGGNREDARAYITELLRDFDIKKKGNADCVITEHVTFSIDDARELRAWQQLTSLHGGKKVRVVYTDFVTREAENALLKTFEEPTDGTHIIFAVPRPDVLLPTLLSRACVVASGKSQSDFSDADFRNADYSVSSSKARKFLALSRADRLAYIAKLVEKSDDENASAAVRERALTLVNDLEKIMAETPQKNRDSLALILELKQYLYLSGGSARIILETLALTC